MESLQILLDTLASKKPLNQAIMMVESGDGSFNWSGVAGKAIDNKPLSPDMPYFIASIDKLFNATIVLKLTEQGLLSLDDPISAYLPDTLTRRLHVLNGNDLSEKITIRHLLSHTTGLPDWLEDAPKNGKSLFEEVIDEGDRAMTFEEIIEHVRGLKPHFFPQDLAGNRVKARYSDTNFVLIIALIEAICNQPLHQVHAKMFYNPLGMNNTFCPGMSEPLEKTLPPVSLRAGGNIIEIPRLMASIRCIYSTSGDMITFMRSLTRGEVFQKPETFSQMQAHWNRFGFPMDRAALRSPNWPVEYGLGIKRFQIPKLFTSLRSLPAVIGHTGSTGCWLFWCPEMDLFFAGSVDEVGAGAVPYRVMPQLLRIFQEKN